MERHFHEQLQKLREKLTVMSRSVEESIEKSIQSVMLSDAALAEEVFSMDDAINRMEMDIDDDCLKLLALQQPMAADLRFIMAAMKINNDLERMGDHSVNIAGYSKSLSGPRSVRLMENIPKMARIVRDMVSESLAAFVEGDAGRARAVCLKDDEVDRLDDALFKDILNLPHPDSESVSRSLAMVLISKNLERIADLSTNIAEEVIFIVQARTIKHHSELSLIEDRRAR
ncbi:MAG: phosphate signaling complex protein PhoU [bacterium]|nr:phosphate signaling complex protein PhoU [bacterium]